MKMKAISNIIVGIVWLIALNIASLMALLVSWLAVSFIMWDLSFQVDWFLVRMFSALAFFVWVLSVYGVVTTAPSIFDGEDK